MDNIAGKIRIIRDCLFKDIHRNVAFLFLVENSFARLTIEGKKTRFDCMYFVLFNPFVWEIFNKFMSNFSPARCLWKTDQGYPEVRSNGIGESQIEAYHRRYNKRWKKIHEAHTLLRSSKLLESSPNFVKNINGNSNEPCKFYLICNLIKTQWKIIITMIASSYL